MSVGVQRSNNREQKDGDGELSEADKQALVSSWEVVWTGRKKPIQMVRGTQFFLILFKRRPESLKYFPRFQGVKLQILETDTYMKSIGLNVMTGLHNFIDNLDDKDLLMNLITNMIKSHQIRNIGAEQMSWVAEVMHDILDLAYDGKCPQYIKEAWSKFCGMIFDVAVAVNA